MTELMSRNIQLAREALEKKDIRYFSTPESLILYLPCRTTLKHRTLQPTRLKISITPYMVALLFEANLPILMQKMAPDEIDDLLKLIARENYSTIRGGLIYSSETRRLTYRLYCPIPGDMSGFDHEELFIYVKGVKASAAPLSKGYETIIN